MINAIEYHAIEPGPCMLFLGAIHGNEKCGTEAIRRVVNAIEAGRLALQKGSVIFVPIANPRAYEKNLRYVDENLNRIFRVTKNPRSFEARLANILCGIVDRCDVMVDMHSTTAQGKPFLYVDYPTVRNRALASVLGPVSAITGWPELYQKMGRADESYDTTTYAASQGKDCVLIECGQHQSSTASAIAHQALLSSLRHYGLIKGKSRKQSLDFIRMSCGFFRQDKKDVLAQNWKHLDKVKKGQPLILHSDGRVTKAPYDAFIIMPKANASVGSDWLYLGKVK